MWRSLKSQGYHAASTHTESTLDVAAQNGNNEQPDKNGAGVQDPVFGLPRSGPTTGYRLHRFYGRAIATFVPLGVFAYYLWIMLALLNRNPDAVKYGRPGENWIFYSWFVIGVFGINYSRYGLMGIEAAMLQSRHWQVDNLMSLLMHGGNNWGGPAGWLKCLQRLLSRKPRIAGRLWFLLAFISLISFVAMPLSGLSMELADGYVPSSEAPNVIGRTWDDFNSRQVGETVDRGLSAWETGAPPTFPGIGIAYTAPYIDRSQYDFLQTLPNSLPVRGGIADLFLAPQAEAPVNGRAWGLRVGYNCSIVRSASEFTVLHQKYSPDFAIDDWAYPIKPYGTGHIGSSTIHAFNNSKVADPQSKNIWGYAEMGFKAPHSADSEQPAYSGDEPFSFDPNDVEKADILEYALWQINEETYYANLVKEEDRFKDEIDIPVEGMAQPVIRLANGSFAKNTSFFDIKGERDDASFRNSVNLDEYKETLSVSPPIGVRCSVVSSLGAADLHAQSSTFTSFERTPNRPINFTLEETLTPRFGMTAKDILLDGINNILPSTNSPPALTVSNSLYYSGFIQAETLQQSIMRAYAMDALQLMYDGIYSFEGDYLNPNLTSSKPGKFIESGVIPPLVSVVLFAIWAAACALLGSIYGFRRRWSDWVDGYSFFRFGADFTDHVRDQQDFSSVKSYENCDKLLQLPGLVGDSRKDKEIGHITLVEKGFEADREKLYA